MKAKKTTVKAPADITKMSPKEFSVRGKKFAIAGFDKKEADVPSKKK